MKNRTVAVAAQILAVAGFVCPMIGCAGGRYNAAPVNNPYASPTGQVLPPGAYGTAPPNVVLPSGMASPTAAVYPSGMPNDLPFAYPIGTDPAAMTTPTLPSGNVAPQSVGFAVAPSLATGQVYPSAQPLQYSNVPSQPVGTSVGVPLNQLYHTKPLFDFGR